MSWTTVTGGNTGGAVNNPQPSTAVTLPTAVAVGDVIVVQASGNGTSFNLDTCADYSTCHATTLIAGPGALGSCPGGPYDTAYFMRRYSNQFPTNGYLKAIRVYQ